MTTILSGWIIAVLVSFLCGLALGLVIMNLLWEVDLKYFGDKSQLVLLNIKIMIVAVFGLQFDNLIRITLGKRNRN